MKKNRSIKANIPSYLGSVGVFLIIFAQITNFFKIEPFVYWYIVFTWYGYIILVDSMVYLLKKSSYIINHPKKLILLAALSAIFWTLFEFYNMFLPGWFYANLPTRPSRCVPCVFAVSTILPAIFETIELIRSLRIFQRAKIEKIKIHKSLLYVSIFIGLIFIIVPFFNDSPYMWVLVWTGFIFLLDPINYLFHEKSLISQIKSGKLNTILPIFITGYICGVLWEFWNHWAYTKWTYIDAPIFNAIRIYEIPILAFLAYGFFALELYTMYYFIKLLFPKKLEKELDLS